MSLLTGLSNRLTKYLAIGIVKLLQNFAPRLLVEIKERGSVITQMDYAPHKIMLAADSIIEYTTRKNSSKKEPETIRWIETYIVEGDVVYDIGANVGAYSLVIDRHTGGRAKVYAFEPSFSTFAQLNRNIFINSCQGRVIPLYIALSNKTQVSVLNYSSLTPGTALHAVGEPKDHLGHAFKPVFEQPVLSYRIDDLIEDFHIEMPNHIKLDVDGVEWEILQGAEHVLEYTSLKSIQVEMEPSLPSCKVITDYLISKGFRLETVQHHGASPMNTSNYLFVRGPE